MSELGLILGGGGARSAYQAGVLQALAERQPLFAPSILCGVSAGAINVAHWANHTGTAKEKADSLVDLWSDLSVDQVFKTNATSLLGHVVRAGLQATVWGGRKGAPKLRGFVNTAPLRTFLEKALNARSEPLTGIHTNLERGVFRAVALTGTSYSTGETVTWCQGREIRDWERPMRRSEQTALRIDHIMASSALPLFFPAARVGNSWYGDGGIRLHSPLSPALHLGAERVLAISTRYAPRQARVYSVDPETYPAPVEVAGLLMNAIFLDLLDNDVLHLERINKLLEHAPEEVSGGLKKVKIVAIRPSEDLGQLSSEFEVKLPGMFRFLTRRLGTKDTKSPDLLSLVMFQRDYLRRLVDLGRRDFEARADETLELLSG